MKKFVTILDVARKAGLSYSTVSLVLSDKASRYNLREETIQRVREAARELGYVRNINADRFRSGLKQNLIGLLLPSLDTPLFGQIVRGLEQTLRAEGYFLVIAGTNNSVEMEEDYIRQFVGCRYSGFVVLTPNYDPNRYAWLRERSIPLVFIQTLPPDAPDHFLSFDDEAGACLAVRHLIDSGRRRIASLARTDPEQSRFHQTVTAARHQGARRAVGHSRQVHLETFMVPYEYECFVAWVREHCLGPDRFDAVYCHQDLIAAYIQRALQAQGLKVPDDVAVIGNDNDNMDLCESLVPSLTSVDLPRLALGEELGRVMLNWLSAEAGLVEADEVIHRLLTPRLQVRESSASVARAAAEG